MVDGMEPPVVALGPESGRVIAEIVASQKLADDIRAAGEADPLDVACDLLRSAEKYLHDTCNCDICRDQRLDAAGRIRDFLSDHGR